MAHNVIQIMWLTVVPGCTICPNSQLHACQKCVQVALTICMSAEQDIGRVSQYIECVCAYVTLQQYYVKQCI